MISKYRSLALVILLSTTSKCIAQQAGHYEAEEKPYINLKECTNAGGCTSTKALLTLDANWRWVHSTSSYDNCYTGNKWDTSICTDGSTCAQRCALEGVTKDKYVNTYGVEQLADGVKVNFVTNHEYGVNVGSRLYIMDGEDKYKMFYLKNREFTIDIDVSELYCGMNGAMYFVEMDTYGGRGLGNNNAGAKYGTGYCDAQCPHDIKFISGEANVDGWVPNPKDLSKNMGMGKYGTCCGEMDIWEANSMATAYTPHPCNLGIDGKDPQYKCEGIECGDNDKGERYMGVCDKDGCDINPYRMGNREFYGRGQEYTVNTLKPMTVVTQFITDTGTDDGDLVEIKRLYVQDGKIIHSPSSTILGSQDSDLIDDGFCEAKKTLFSDVNDYQAKGGTKAMGDSLDRGQVAALSLWDDVEVNMLWLDAAYPLDKAVTDPGVKRGDCPGGTSSTPTYVRDTHPDGHVIFTNAAIGEIGSTLQVAPTMSPTPAPCDMCAMLPGANTPECVGQSESSCKNMMTYENKCQWFECKNPPTLAPIKAPTLPPPSSSPVKSPTVPPTRAPTAEPLMCKSWCSTRDVDWTKKCNWKKCSGCTECADAPTESSVSESPTKAPVTASDDFCCTWDFFHCGVDKFCNENMVNCQTGCGGIWMEKTAPAMQCIEKFNSCTKNESSCCLGLSCVGGGDTYKQCSDNEMM